MAPSAGAHHRHRVVHQPSRLRKGLARGFMTLTSLAAVLLTGAGYYVAHGALGGITVSQALSAEDPRSNGSGVNILLIGLDSRKDQDGNDLPWSILKQLHAGDSDDGGYNTNTLILVHVGADNKVVAFSIPRDDWVPFNGVPGYNHIKIRIGPQRIFSHLLLVRDVKCPHSLLYNTNARIILGEKFLEGVCADHDPGNVGIDAQQGDGSMAVQQSGDTSRGNPAALHVIVEDIGEISPGGDCQRGTDDDSGDAAR